MNTLHLAIIAVIIVIVGTTAITFLILSDIDKQNQAQKLEARIHVLDDNGTKYVKIKDLEPNSSVIFVYPYTGNETVDVSAFHRWILIRLPLHDGGNKDDISSFRAYSAVDIQLNCLIRYWPTREWLEDPCHGSLYEPVYGIPFAGPAMNYAFKNNALPQLDLDVDKEGYIYVKPPIFEIDKNGAIGYGRQVPSDIFEEYVKIGQSHLQEIQKNEQ